MKFRRQVQCITTATPQRRITHIGGRNPDGSPWRVTTEEAIRGINAGNWEFYVASGQRQAEVIVATRLGTSYLRTRDDGSDSNNLASLQECPSHP